MSLRRRSKPVLFAMCLLCFTSWCAASGQTAQVKRNVDLRSGPSAHDPKMILLKPGDELEVLDPQPTDDFLHVRTQDGAEGWVASKSIVLRQDPARIRTELAAPAGQVADAISADWEKPAPQKTELSGPDGTCPWNGDNSDPDTFVRKNRADTPESDGISYHDVKWEAIAKLPYPVDKPLRKNWTPEDLKVIAPFEGEALRTTGYLVAYKPQSGGSGEGTNCHFNDATETDTHMALVQDVGDAEKTAVVIEFTPRFLKAHRNWNKAKLTAWLNAEDPVRISGWLMLDPDHRNHLGRFRSTLWELHPITKIEVWKDGQWQDLDSLP